MAGDDGHAWKCGYASNEQLGEGPPSLEIEVESELVQDIDMSNISERRCLKRACSVEIHEAVLYIPCCDRTTVLPVVSTVESQAKISCCMREVSRVAVAEDRRGTHGTPNVA